MAQQAEAEALANQNAENSTNQNAENETSEANGEENDDKPKVDNENPEAEDSKGNISFSQCGNCMIFQLLRFYVKSILGDSRSANPAIFRHLEALDLEFYEFLHFLKVEILQINKIQSP